MAQPDSTYPFATLDGATLEPDDSAKLSGFAANDKPPARWHNWLFNGAHRWFEYVKNLHNEPDFLSKDYSWTGLHRLARAYTTNNWGVRDEVLYVNDAGEVVTKERVVQLPFASFAAEPVWNASVGGYVSPWRFSAKDPLVGRAWSKPVDGGPGLLTGEWQQPSASTLTKLRLSVAITAGGSTVKVETGRYWTKLLDADTDGAFQEPLADMTISATGIYDLVLPTPHAHFGDYQTGYVTFDEQGTGGVAMRWVKLHFADPGPRNF